MRKLREESGYEESCLCECKSDAGLQDIRHQVSLELVQIDVQRSVESQGCSDGGDDLSDKTVEVGEGRRHNAEVATADVVDAVDHQLAEKSTGRIRTPHCLP